MNKEPTLSEEAIAKIRIEMVFSLASDELHVPSEKFPDPWDEFPYWYEGVPCYVSNEYPNYRECPFCTGGASKNNTDTPCEFCGGIGQYFPEFRTLIVDLFPDTLPKKITTLGAVWILQAQFTNSGETPCWFCEWDKEYSSNCPICDDGLVYIGDGWVEATYQKDFQNNQPKKGDQ